jgi:hypothetical protein
MKRTISLQCKICSVILEPTDKSEVLKCKCNNLSILRDKLYFAIKNSYNELSTYELNKIKTMTMNGKTYELKRFMYQCDLCMDKIESTDNIHTITCLCKNLSIRGGIKDIGFVSSIIDLITDISEWKLVE